jgi:hypothetical protein
LGKLDLVIAPDSGSLKKALDRLAGQPFSWVYLGQDVAAFHRAVETFRQLGERLDIAAKLDQAARYLRNPYLAYVFALSHKPNSLCWWLTSVSYRASYTSKTFYQSCQLRVALDLAESWDGPGPLVVVAADRPVRQALQRNAGIPTGSMLGDWRVRPLQPVGDLLKLAIHRCFFLARETRRLIQARRLIRRLAVLAEETTLLVSTVHPGNLKSDGDFHRVHWGELADRLTAMGAKLAMVPLVLRSVPYREAVQRVLRGSAPVVLPHRYLRITDLLRAVVSSARPIRLEKPLPPLDGMDIGPLVREDLRIHWVSNRGADGLLLEAFTRRLAQTGASVARIIFKFENQPWERALCWGTKRHLPAATTVGFQHARAPSLYLNYYLAPGEAEEAPLPDRVVTIGKHTAGLLSLGGYAPQQVRAGAALHIPVPVFDGNQAGETRPEAPTVLIAGSYGAEESYELASIAFGLFGEDDGVDVVLKCHPSMPYKDFQHLMRTSMPAHVRLSDEPITDLTVKSSLMVYTGSMVSVQALAAGLPVVHLRSEFDLDLDPLGAVPEIRLEATGLEDMRKQVKWLLANRSEYIAKHQDRWATLVKEIYGPVTDEAIKAFVD